eukprot:14020739-Alexandrium_andersonii.AAC.1
MELLGSPFELSCALQTGRRAEGIVDTATPEEAVRRHRRGNVPAKAAGALIPRAFRRPAFDAVGLRPGFAELLWGS